MTDITPIDTFPADDDDIDPELDLLRWPRAPLRSTND